MPVKEKRINPRTPLLKICDDAGINGIGKTEWKYDADVKKYRRYDKGVPFRSIRGENIPDPNKIRTDRSKTAEILVKYVSAEKMQEIADVAISKGKDPGKEILNQLKVRTEPSQAVQLMWDHWQGVKDA